MARTTRTAISLFSGAGGDTLGLTNAGFDVVAFNEVDKDAIQSHLNKFPSSELIHHDGVTDIKQIPDSVFEKYHNEVDLIFAGFPCQGFSHAGKKKVDDSRNELVCEVARIVNVVKPKWIIGENVSGLLSRKGTDPVTKALRPVIDIIKDLFAEIGYALSWSVHDVRVYGVPQARKRLIIIGKRGKVPMDFPQPHEIVNNQHIGIRRILQSTLQDATIIEDKDLIEQEPSTWIHTDEEVPGGTPHKNLLRLLHGDEVLEQARQKGYKIKSNGCLLSIGKRVSPFHGEIMNPDSFSKTIICNYNRCPRLFVGLVNPTSGKHYVRTLQIQELAQIQGFSADYPFSGSRMSIIHQIGNAVPPPLVAYIAKYILSTYK